MRCWATIGSTFDERPQCSRYADAATEWVYPLCGQHRRIFENIDFKGGFRRMEKALIARMKRENEVESGGRG